MPRAASETRRRIVENAYRLFYREGFQRTGMDSIAAAAGLTKRTLYNHYPSKDDLIAEALAAQTELATEEIRRWCGTGQATPEDLIRASFGGLRDWTRAPGWRGSGFTRAVIELAHAPGHPARLAAARHKRAVETVLCDALAAAGAAGAAALARQIAVLIEGALVLLLVHGEEDWIRTAEESALTLVREARQQDPRRAQ